MPSVQLFTSWADQLAADIGAAKKTITISTMSFSPPRRPSASPFGKLWSALCDAPKQGAHVIVYLPATSSTHPATWNNNHAAHELHKSGIHCVQVQVMRLLHAKTAVIDGRIVWVGSGNWTAAAAHFNHEAYLRAESPELAESLTAHWIESFTAGA